MAVILQSPTGHCKPARVYLSATSIGRQLEGQRSALYGLAKVILAALRRLRLPTLPDGRLARLALLASGALLVRLLRRSLLGKVGAARQSAAEAQKQAICDAAPARPGKKEQPAPTQPPPEQPSQVMTFAQLVTPGAGRRPTGSLETLGMVAASALACLVMGRQGRLIGLMEEAQIKKDRRAFRWLLLQYPICCATAAVLVALADNIKSRLALEWRQVATQRLHDLYFSSMNYYKVQHDRTRSCPDADAVICSDLKEVATNQAAVVHSFASSVTMSLVFSVQIKATLGSWKVALLSPAIVFLLLPAMVNGVPALLGCADLSWVHAKKQAAMAAYRRMLSRLQVHGERVAMLRGTEYELEELDTKLREAVYWSGASTRATSTEEFCASLVFSPSVDVAFAAGLCLLYPAINGTAQAIREGAVASPMLPWEARTANLADMSTYTQSFTYSLFALKSWAGCLTALLNARSGEGAQRRVLCLAQHLSDLEQEARSQQQATAVLKDSGPGGSIAFRGVAVQTPSGVRLLEKLSFEVRQGQSLLISGHNGAGKSSIMRCLCNLWAVPTGCIERPGGAASAEQAIQSKQFYYLPQKAVSVIGNLSDLLTYPVKLPDGLSESELRCWLGYVDLAYLVDRELAAASPLRARSGVLRTSSSRSPGKAASRSLQGLDDLAKHDMVDWSQVLSTGEQQAVSIARLLYHRPRFAVLDECTSAVSRTLERRLYELAHELGISVVSIAHRPALESMHGSLLRLTGNLQDGRGWQLQDLPGREALEAKAPKWCQISDEAHGRICAVLDREVQAPEPEGEPDVEGRQSWAAPGPPAEGDASSISGGKQKPCLPICRPEDLVSIEAMASRRWPSALSRLRAMLELSSSQPGSGWQLALRGGALAGLLTGHVKVHWELWKALAGAVRGALCGDLQRVWVEAISYVLLQLLKSSLDHAFRMSLRNFFRATWLSSGLELHRRAVTGGAFLQTMHPMRFKPSADSEELMVSGIADPIDRISNMNEGMPEAVAELELVGPQLAMGLFAVPLLLKGAWGSTRSVLALPACAGLFGLVSWVIAPDWAWISKQLGVLEAKYQALHSRLRRIAEPVAFNGGGSWEREIVQPAFDSVQAFSKASLKDEFLHRWATLMLTNFDFLPQLVTRLLNYDFALRNNPDLSQGLAAETVFVTLLYGRVIDYVRTGLLTLGPAKKAWAALDGNLMSALELVEGLRLVAENATSTEANACLSLVEGSDSKAWKLSEVDLHVPLQPGRPPLARGLKLELREGKGLLVTGPSGSGKSLLAQALLSALSAGLAGSSDVPSIGTAPQHIYLPVGSLGDQICYPQRYLASQGQEDRMLCALRAAGLAYLFGREEAGWQAERDWEDVLSGGEQQRLQLARLFYHRPSFAILDDCTSMVASADEQGLYRTMVKKFGITPITLSQRAFLREFYGQELRLGAGRAGWTLQAPSPKS
eukprot:TRINITY_DN25926_c0_g1_i1.p1 TRINITY_DN25926_c0_g1~~TRINITY_DN25926_c0_g1_i1.p1  ORF type:complete len:1458 (+),score=299.51 TRINITY_DN25926_c0_g1_i1:23-4375(+)